MYAEAVEYFLIPIYDLARGTSRFKCARILDKTQRLPIDQVKRLQTSKLRGLLRHAFRTTRYYHDMFTQVGLQPDDMKLPDDLLKLPVLTKSKVRSNLDHLLSDEFRRDELIPYRTGGTGSPLRFFLTKDQVSWEVAAEYRSYGWARYRLGDRCLMVWGSPIDLGSNRGSGSRLATRVTRSLERVTLIDPWVLSDGTFDRFQRLISSFRPSIIRGYAGPVSVLAGYLCDKDLRELKPKAVITSAETLFDSMRRTIEAGFGCPVFDYYGSREFGAIASECEEHSGYHVAIENVFLEFVKDGEHVASGESGEIFVTGLNNYGMPLIRYQIGDVGKPSDETCTCGRGLPLMGSLQGRASQFLCIVDKVSGKKVPIDASVVMDYLMIHLKSPIESFRIIQESLDLVSVEVKSESLSKSEVDFLLSELRRLLGEGVRVEVDVVEFIPPLPSGKRSSLISKVSAFHSDC